ncbi:FAD/NAD(P)-binding domain-containing protein [Xylaria bambusicola]|uniref:FAD/NAD(P)-binding domain-containing protein n=1 Tax=Xylaria bambusicola TaxID=326684 RepID=UPI0020085AF6|nr:FAD/NAD(P)-binding domain-containing protein [Xylaria bambusicola]KAI0521076.1 FAD/NAD(P)-binding domain-containing protein [Xylaria bambusicola]
MAGVIYILTATPFLLVHYLLDIVRFVSPRGRPLKEWTFNQAVRVRTVRLLLVYWAFALAGDRLTLKPGRERNRFDVFHPKSQMYKGPLSATKIQPKAIGATWTPAQPSLAEVKSRKATVVLHFHGGAYVIGDGRDHDTGYLAKTLVRHMGCKYVCTPQYRLSTHRGGHFPAALQDAVTSYIHLVEEMDIPASQIILSGDSAGGNMVLGLLRYIDEYGQDLGIPSPAAVALWSPWTDVSAALDVTQDITKSPYYMSDYLSAEFARWGGRAITAYGSIDASGPYLSPLHHPFQMTTRIPMFVNGGGGEVLCDDIKAFSKTFEKHGWPVHLVVSKHCPHDILLLGPRLGFHRDAEAAVRDAKAHQMAIKLQSNEPSPATTLVTMDFDVIIVGAGISGINTAYRLQEQGPPGMKYVILESRDSMGGTWDLFRYPGIRSDSDVYTFGLPWSPWKGTSTFGSGDEIKHYLIQSAKSVGIDQYIRYQHKVETADWHPAEQSWHFQVKVAGKEKPVIFRSRFCLLGTGYYDYETPMQTIIPGIENFKGKVIHPQFWPKDYDYTGKDVVIIGSGATAITILPSIIDKVKSATMLQRSPGYIFSRPASNFLTRLMFAILPLSIAHRPNRIIWALKSWFTTWLCKNFPGAAKKRIRDLTIQQLPSSIKWDPHFKPRYNPWEQRFCACVDGDFFAALRSGKGNVVTDKIKMVTANSIELESGAALHPDVILTATGLKLKFGGGIQFSIDGKEFKIGDKFSWKAAMLDDVPNLLFMTGYENASWTLGADVSAHLFIRLLHLMEQKNAKVIVPRSSKPMEEKPMMNLSSTYIKKAGREFPMGGSEQWSPKTNYFADMAGAKYGSIEDLYFS